MADFPICDQCGQPHIATMPVGPGAGKIGQSTGRRARVPACTGHISWDNPDGRKKGDPCGNPPMPYQDVCDKHGGKTPQALAKARRTKAEADASAALARIVPDQPSPVTDPIGVLARLAGEADQVRAAAAAKVNELAADPNADPELVIALFGQYERFLDRTTRTCEALVRSNYIERHAAIETAQIVALLAVVQRGLELIPDPEMRRAVTSEIATGLKRLPVAS